MSHAAAQPTAQLIDGKAAAKKLCAELAQKLPQLTAQGIVPHIAFIRVGDDAASLSYVRSKQRLAAKLGLKSSEHTLPATTNAETLAALIAQLNANPDIHGILLQLPLPETLHAAAFLALIDPAKDVDGFHPLNVGLLAQATPAFVPCTPQGCMRLLHSLPIKLAGLRALVLGRSAIVGRPMAQLLLQANCTVTIAHSASRNLPDLCANADIVVAAIGRPHFIDGAWLKAGAIALDVGLTRHNNQLCGDIEPVSAAGKAAFLTPVPGGVGPMTVACLMHNVMLAASRQHSLPQDMP